MNRVGFLVFVRAGMRGADSGVNDYFPKLITDPRNGIVDAVTALNVRSIFGKGVVWIAIEPAFARLSRCDHRMSTGMSMFAGVPIRRAVAAKRDSTCLACPQMYPIGTDLYTLFTFTALRLFDRLNRNRVQMRTTPGIHDRLA